MFCFVLFCYKYSNLRMHKMAQGSSSIVRTNDKLLLWCKVICFNNKTFYQKENRKIKPITETAIKGWKHSFISISIFEAQVLKISADVINAVFIKRVASWAAAAAAAANWIISHLANDGVLWTRLSWATSS